MCIRDSIDSLKRTSPPNSLNWLASAKTVPSSTFFADENQTAIGAVSATDPDGDGIVYSISGSEININASSGVLTFASAPDFETKSSYTATVTASDGTNSTTQAIKVTIIDVQENRDLTGACDKKRRPSYMQTYVALCSSVFKFAPLALYSVTYTCNIYLYNLYI